MIAELTPQSFQEVALAWIGVATIMVGALSGFVALVIAKVAQIRADAAAKQGVADHATNKANITALQSAVTTIALQTPAPENKETPQQVIVANAKSDPVPTTEEKKPEATKITRRIK